MKLVIAFIRDRKLPDVAHALHGVGGVTGMTASSVRGFGRSGYAKGKHDAVADLEVLEQRTRVDVFCSDGDVEAVVRAIADTAHTGLRGDGKVYVVPVADALRIETGARGEGAI